MPGQRRERGPRRPPNLDSPLVFNVSTLLTESIGETRHQVLHDDTFRFRATVGVLDGHVAFLRTDHSILARVEAHLETDEVCAYCLAPVRVPLPVRFEEEFWPDFDPLTHARVVVPAGREGFPIVAGHLDLREALRQYGEMARPMRPACPPDQCASDFRRRPAAAAEAAKTDAAATAVDQDPVDSRWAALEDWRNRAAKADPEE